jgi:hypothetical protein
MAEEGTLGQARSAHDERDGDDEPSKQELQRRMEEARETITQTVTEIKETVTNQYYSMKETVSDALDWRHHFRKNPIAFSVGALSVGFLLGYGLTGTIKGSGDGSREDYPSSEESDIYARTGASAPRYEDEAAQPSADQGHAYAAQPSADQGGEASDYESAASYPAAGEDESYNAQRAGASVSYISSRTERGGEAQPEKPGLFERFKGTSAYNRLETEVSSLGDRFIDELSTTAHTVVLPALFNKLKELFGVDLSNKEGGQQQSEGSGGQAQSSSGAQQPDKGTKAASASASSSAASLASASRGSSPSSYGTSENRGYGAQSNASEADRGGDGSSVLDLDR